MYSDTYIYVLELNGGNFYVGKTNNIAKRFNDHKNGRGSAWTRLHGGCKIIEIHNNENLFDEDKYTLDFMNMFGVDKVRGGSFSNIELTEEQKNIIGKSIRNANDLCQECGESGHFMSDCPSKEEPVRLGRNNKSCSRCFRTGHSVKECYAKTNAYGKFI